MVKVYDWLMEAVHDMGARSAEGWEYVAGPVEGRQDWACLMRREVVPGRVVQSDPKPGDAVDLPGVGPVILTGAQLHNCWSCKHATEDTDDCRIYLRAAGVAEWVDATHGITSPRRCPPEAYGCPGWTPKATP
jgi:hypothetical protein